MADSKQKELTMAEIATHNTKESAWIVIKDSQDGDTPKVYDVTNYLDDHPGGAEVVLEVAGDDATNMFEDIGHSTDARTEMKKHQIGVLQLTEEEKAKMAAEAEKKSARQQRQGGGLNPLAVVFLLLAIAFGYYYSQTRQ